MKRSFLVGLGAVALLASGSYITELPAIAKLLPATEVAQNPQAKRQVQLNLTAAKKVVQQAEGGKQQVSWQPLQGKVTVQPGDVIRYTVTGQNNSDRPVKNLVVTQPIPKQTVYVLNSASINNTATVTYSIDNGKTFVAKPTVKVKLTDGKVVTQPAPATAYTHVRWKFGQAINPKATAAAAYQVRVR